jgi:type VI secretion system protein ImpA
MAQFQEDLRETPAEFLRDLVDDLTACVDEYEKLGALLDERCGKDSSGFPLAPPSSNIRNALRTCLEVVQIVGRDVLAAAQPVEEQKPGEGGSAGAPAAAVSAPGKIQNREQAFQAILQVAEFFRRAEPQSPVAYKLEEAVRWGRMPLPDLLAELISEDGVRNSVFKLMGIHKKEG